MKKFWYLINDNQLRGWKGGGDGGLTTLEWDSLSRAKDAAKLLTEGNGKVTYILELIGTTKVPVDYEAVYEEPKE